MPNKEMTNEMRNDNFQFLLIQGKGHANFSARYSHSIIKLIILKIMKD